MDNQNIQDLLIAKLIEQYEAQIDALKKTITSLQEEITKLSEGYEAQIADQKATIASLREDITNLRS